MPMLPSRHHLPRAWPARERGGRRAPRERRSAGAAQDWRARAGGRAARPASRASRRSGGGGGGAALPAAAALQHAAQHSAPPQHLPQQRRWCRGKGRAGARWAAETAPGGGRHWEHRARAPARASAAAGRPQQGRLATARQLSCRQAGRQARGTSWQSRRPHGSRDMSDAGRQPEERGYPADSFRNDRPGRTSGKMVRWQPHPCAPQAGAVMDYAAELDFGRLGPAWVEIVRCVRREGLFPSTAERVTTIDAPPPAAAAGAGEGAAAGAPAPPKPKSQ